MFVSLWDQPTNVKQSNSSIWLNNFKTFYFSLKWYEIASTLPWVIIIQNIRRRFNAGFNTTYHKCHHQFSCICYPPSFTPSKLNNCCDYNSSCISFASLFLCEGIPLLGLFVLSFPYPKGMVEIFLLFAFMIKKYIFCLRNIVRYE